MTRTAYAIHSRNLDAGFSVVVERGKYAIEADSKCWHPDALWDSKEDAEVICSLFNDQEPGYDLRVYQVEVSE